VAEEADALTARNRLLIVDDEINIGLLFARAGEAAGYAVRTETDPSLFAACLREFRPTHLILDLQMPGRDGIDLLRELAALSGGTEVFLTSGVGGRVLDTVRRIGEELKLHIRAVIAKPFRATEVTSLLSQARRDAEGPTAADLAQAIAEGAIGIALQPIIETETRRPTGFEALARWRHPKLGTISPAVFIPLAEASGQTQALTMQVVRQVKEAMRMFHTRSLAPWISINVSGQDISDAAFCRLLSETLCDGPAGAGRYKIELTEQHLTVDPHAAISNLSRLRLAGHPLAMDDFGTGHSSLLQLLRYPFSELKIDLAFVKQCATRPDALTVVRASINLAHSLGLACVAEGVEDDATLGLLTSLGCDMCQGFLLGRPMGLGDALSYLEKARETLVAYPLMEGQSQSTASVVARRASDLGDEQYLVAERLLTIRIDPLWALGRNTLVGWKPADLGIDVLIVPYDQIVDHFAESRRLLHGERLMGEGTFHLAGRVLTATPVHVPLPFRVTTEGIGGIPADVVERILRRYGITETLHRGVALFDIVGFSKVEPMYQVAQLNNLDRSVSAAHAVLTQLQRQMDLARTSTGDGYYIWNRSKGPDADINTYLLMLLVLADLDIARNSAPKRDRIPVLRSCFSIGQHYSYYQVDGLQPRGHDYIVGDVTIKLARMASDCLASQILVGDFERPGADGADAFDPLSFIRHASDILRRLEGLTIGGHVVRRVSFYFTGEKGDDAAFRVSRYSIEDKHGFRHKVYNQKLNIYLESGARVGLTLGSLYLGLPRMDLTAFPSVAEESLELTQEGKFHIS